MRRLIILVFMVVFFYSSFQAQTRRMANPEQARTFTVQQQSRTNWPLLQKAEQEMRLFDFESSYFTLENAVAQNPYSAEALVLRARLKRLVGMEAEAITDLNLANRLNPYAANLFGYSGNSGLLQIMASTPETAIQDLSAYKKLSYYYQAVDEKATDDNTPQKELLQLESIIKQIEDNNLDSAFEKTEQLLSMAPELAIAYDLKGLILTKQDKTEEALTAFSRAVTLEPGFAIAWYNLGKLEQTSGNFQQAKIYFDRAIKLQDDLIKAYFDRAALLKAMGETELALQDYDKIIEINGSLYVEAFINRGLTKKMLGDFNGALADLDRVIDEYPDNPELLKNRGNLFLLFGSYHQALDDYSEALKLDRNYAEAYYNRALTHFLLYDNISGCADLEKSANLGFTKAKEKQSYFCID